MEKVAVVSLVVAILVALLIVGIAGFFLLRSRIGEGVHLNQRLLLRVYMHLGTLAGMVLLAAGAAGLVRAGLGATLGYNFSYYPQYVSYPRPVLPPGTTPAETPTTAEQQQARAVGLERAYKEGLLNGISYTLVGLIVWGAHVIGRRKLTYTTEADTVLERAYVLLIVFIFGIVMLVNLPQAVFETLRFYILKPLDDFSQPNPPGDNVSWATVSLPIWVRYLFVLIRDVRRHNEVT